MKRVHVIVDGSVQGVGYRYTLRLEAQAAGAAGWVRNRSDGTVEAEIEGEEGVVDDVLSWMAEGPPGSRVNGARLREIPVEGTAGFEVRATV